MTGGPVDILSTGEWQALETKGTALESVNLRQLFAGDPGRVDVMTRTAATLTLDFSKQRVDREAVNLLLAVARRAGVAERRDAMFAGEHVNPTEDRAVLHTALRLPADASLVVDGQDVVADVHRVLGNMAEIANDIRNGRWTGSTGKRIRTVVNIGIGGSDLGPAMAHEALADAADGPDCRFVSNIDPVDLWSKISGLDPAETLFLVCSKTFTTLETLTNASVARRWVLDGLHAGPEAVQHHFLAVSTNDDAVRDFGIDVSTMFGFWDWVGGRYSYDSAIGFSLMIAIGPEQFTEMLEGFHRIDRHFLETPFEDNVPVLLGMLNVWNGNILGAQSHAVLPYAQRLARFPAYLQQLTMESNGKSVRWDGTPVAGPTGAVWWGEPGTNGQHAFHQLLHQGTRLVPADFIAFAHAGHEDADQHDLLLANCLAQSAVLAFGRTAEEVAADGTPSAIVPHKVMPGNRPSSTIVAPKLTPSVLGQLVALYEHTVFVEGVVWGIDSFDQWGVELGKAMARTLAPLLTDEAAPDLTTQDTSTASLLRRLRTARGRPI